MMCLILPRLPSQEKPGEPRWEQAGIRGAGTCGSPSQVWRDLWVPLAGVEAGATSDKHHHKHLLSEAEGPVALDAQDLAGHASKPRSSASAA